MVSAPGGGDRISIRIGTSGADKSQREVNSVSRSLVRLRAVASGMRSGRLARLTSGILSLGATVGKVVALTAAITALGGALAALSAAGAAAITPLAGLGVAAGGLAGAFAGGILAAENADKKLKQIKKSASEAIEPLQAFSSMSFSALRTGVSFLGDLASMLRSIKPEITAVTEAWGSAFSSERSSIVDQLRKTIVAFLPALQAFGTYLIKNVGPGLAFLREEGQKALPFLSNFLKWLVTATGAFIRFGNQVLPSVASALRSVAGAFQRAGQLAMAFYAGMDGTGALVIFRNLLRSITGIFGQLTPGIEGATNAGRAFGNAVVSVANFVDRVRNSIKLFALVLTGVVGPATQSANVLSIVKGALQSIWTTVKPLAKIVQTQLTTAFGAFQQMLVAVRPSLQQLLGLWQRNRSTIMPFVKAVLSLIGPLGQLAAAIGSVLIPVLVGFAQGVWSVIRPLINMLTPAIQALGPIISTLATKIQTWAQNNQQLLVKIGKLAGIIAGLFAPIGTLLGLFGRVIGVVARIFPRFGKLISVFGRTGSAITRLVQQFVQFGQRVTSTIVSTFTRISSRIGSAMGRVRSIIQSGWNAARSIVTRVLGRIAGVASQKWNQIRSVIASALAAIRSGMSSAWSTIRSTVTSAMNRVRSIIQSGWNRAKSIVNSTLSGIRSTVRSSWNQIRSRITNAMNRVRGFIQNVWNRIRSIITNALNRMRGAVTGAMGKINRAVRRGFNNVRTKVRNGINGAVSLVQNAGSRFLNAGKGLMRSFAKGIGRAAGKVTGKVKQVVSDVKSFLPGSDADRGPLATLSESGPAIPQMLADGMERYRGMVSKAADKIAGAAKVNPGAAFEGRATSSRSIASMLADATSGSTTYTRSRSRSTRSISVNFGGITIQANSRAEGRAAGGGLVNEALARLSDS